MRTARPELARLLLAIAQTALVAGCGDGDNPRSMLPQASVGGAAGRAGAAASGNGGSIASAGIGGGGGSGASTTLGAYPRTYADASLTRPLATGEIRLVGELGSACSHGQADESERWCAFARGPKEGPVSLWVVNVTHALETDAPPCDEPGPDCVKLTDHLWTGEDLWGPSHPRSHRFDGDTLIFYADAEPLVRQPYAGPIFAWRPGWAEARRIAQEGVMCTGHQREPVVYCVESLDASPRELGMFGGPVWHAFDLYAGSLEPAAAELSLVEHITLPAQQQWAFRASFDRKGERLAYSSIAPSAEHEALRYVSLATLGSALPVTVLDDASQWYLSHDGAAVYALRGFGGYLGELVVADFPSGKNLKVVAQRASHIDPVGEFDDPSCDEDRGVGYEISTDVGYGYEFLSDRSNVKAVTRLGDAVTGPRVAASGAHTLLFHERGDDWPVARVVDNATGMSCTLNWDFYAETYNGQLSRDSKRAAWIELGRGSEEGFVSAMDCSGRTKFGDWVIGYSLHGDFVVFVGGDQDDSTTFLQYTRLPSEPGTGSVTPLIVHEHPRYPAPTVDLDLGSYVVFAGDFGSPAVSGLYLHGPLERSF